MVIFVLHFFRGTDSHGQAPFRAAYSRVGNIKAILKGPMLCLTATASTKLRGKIIKMLNMTCQNHSDVTRQKKCEICR